MFKYMYLSIVYYIPYIILIILFIIMLCIAYIKVKFGFWSIQPVFHIYDFYYMVFPPGIILHSLPKKNKYCNFKQINTILFSQITDYKMTKFIHFIQSHYLRNKNNIYLPSKKNILPYFHGHLSPCFFTVYNEEYLLEDKKTKEIINDSKILGTMTARPLHITIHQHLNSTFDVYYIEYLCVDSSYRKKGIAPEIIQTHEYNQRHLNEKISISLFKRENTLTGIVPLCIYNTYGYPVYKWTKPLDLPPLYKILEIGDQTLHFFNEFLKEYSTKFDIFIVSEMSNMLELIKTKNIYIYVILLEDEIVSAYFFRKSCVKVDNNMEVLTCYASINTLSEENKDIFIQGYKVSFWKIADKEHFGFAALENISHNHIIIDNLSIKTKPLVISPTAYFFYNFAYPTFKPEKVLILN